MPHHQEEELIEVAFPLEVINAASAREKSIRHVPPARCTRDGHGGR